MKKPLRFLRSYLLGYSLEKRSSSLNPFLEVVYVNGRLKLKSRTVSYSYGGPDAVYNKAFRKFRVAERKPAQALVLGFGTGNAVCALQKEYEMTGRIVGVEADPVVLDLAKKYFDLDKIKNFELHCMDAYDFVLKCREQFDLIAMDVFVDKYVPDKFHQTAFVEKLTGLLSGRGILFFNYISFDDRTENTLRKLKLAFSSVRGRTTFHPLSFLGVGNIIIVHEKNPEP